MLTIALPGYDRGTPFSFKLGSGQVIKGFVQATTTTRGERVGKQGLTLDKQMGRGPFGHVYRREEVG